MIFWKEIILNEQLINNPKAVEVEGNVKFYSTHYEFGEFSKKQVYEGKCIYNSLGHPLQIPFYEKDDNDQIDFGLIKYEYSDDFSTINEYLYSDDDQLIRKKSYIYENQKKTQEIIYTDAGRPYITYYFNYDNEKIIEKLEYNNTSPKPDTERGDLHYIFKYIYDDNQRLKAIDQYLKYFSKEIHMTKTIFRYDEHGNKTEEMFYNVEKEPQHISSINYKYNGLNQLIEEIHYLSLTEEQKAERAYLSNDQKKEMFHFGIKQFNKTYSYDENQNLHTLNYIKTEIIDGTEEDIITLSKIIEY